MKQKLLLALAFLAMLSSTSCREEFYVDTDNNQENYLRNFIHEFGLIDPKQDWGFSPATASSRSAAPMAQAPALSRGQHTDVNGNQWKNPPLVKDWERKAVMEYLHRNGSKGDVRGTSKFDLGSQYFVTQVGSCHNIYHGKEACGGTHTYDFDRESPRHGLNGMVHGHVLAEDGHNPHTSFDKMNYLHVAYQEPYSWSELSSVTATEGSSDTEQITGSWVHVNNFNRSENTNFGGNTVVIGGAYDFAYKSTLDNQWYDNYIVIPGDLIDYRLSAYYYLCFDFKATHQQPSTTLLVKVKLHKKDVDEVYEREANIDISGAYTSVEALPQNDIVAALQTEFPNNGEGDYYVSHSTCTIKQVNNADQYVLPDGIYDDWVIRLCGNAISIYNDAIPVYPYDDYSAYRIFVEDLSVSANYEITNSTSDWDFNDLVFDATPYVQTSGEGEGATSENRVKLTIRALGGTMPIYIGKYNTTETFEPVEELGELHDFMDVPRTTMINTGTGATAPIKTIDLPASYFDMDFTQMVEVQVQVNKEIQTKQRLAGSEFNKITVWVESGGKMVQMKAETGKAPSKLCVPSYLAAPTERLHITIPYPNFKNYVGDSNVTFWEAPVSAH